MELAFIETLKSQPLWFLILFSLGSLVLLKRVFRFLNWVYVTFFRPAKNLKKYGSWALITGPTDGIGKAFAFQFAKKGINVVLVGRNISKLESVRDWIHEKYPDTKIVLVDVDFSGDIDEGVSRMKEAIEGLDIGVLINNVGASYPYGRYLHEVDDALLRHLIRLNVESTSKVTRAVIGGMVTRKRGAIVNIGSASATVLPSDPLYCLYAAAKAYVDQFSRCLYVEYKNKGIDVQCQVPLYVATKMSSIRRSSFFVPSPETYAKAGMRWIGYGPRCSPYWRHSVVWNLVNCLPEFVMDAWKLQYSLKIRTGGLLKDSRKKK